MGTASIVCGLIGVCAGWVPTVGWFSGAAMGVLACALGIPSVTRWYGRAGYGPWGISGIILGIVCFPISVAYQIKYAAGGLDALVLTFRGPQAYIFLAVFTALTVVGIVWARKHENHRHWGEMVAGVAIATLWVIASWTLITLDRDFDRTAQRAIAPQIDLR